jgi:hypothetical protein
MQPQIPHPLLKPNSPEPGLKPQMAQLRDLYPDVYSAGGGPVEIVTGIIGIWSGGVVIENVSWG